MPRPLELFGVPRTGPAVGTAINGGAGTGLAPEVLILAGRDSTHPDGGGSELYIERIAAGLVRLGHRVTLFCGDYPGATPEEWVQGVRVLRRGGRLSVFAHAALWLRTGRLGRPAVIVDVHNGLPFFTRWYTRTPVLVLVHHVHREQWQVCFGPLVGRLGWSVESRVAPRAYRRAGYVTVSERTRAELAGLGVAPGRIAIVHNGVDLPASPLPPKTAHPSICVLGRLVPNKRVELAFQAVVELRRRHPGLRVDVVGKGYWEPRLRAAATLLGLDGVVTFHGWVDEAVKRELLARSWVLAMPSLKEGWGLAVTEAAAHATPAVGFAAAGGLAESVRHGETGLLAADYDGFTRGLDVVLGDACLRRRLGEAARVRAAEFAWERSADAFSALVNASAARRRAGAGVRPGGVLIGGLDRIGAGSISAARPVTIRNMPVPDSTQSPPASLEPVERGGIEHMGGSA
jgi:glycosyltransferase involved in cell wall biosynthesis